MDIFDRILTRKQMRRWLQALLVFGAIAFLGCGCTKAARQARHLERANGYFEGGQYQAAEIEYLNALRLDAQSPVANRRLGTIYYDQGRFQAAFLYLQRAKELAPDDLDARAKLAAIISSAGQPAQAREELLRVLAKDPAHPEALEFLAQSATAAADIKDTRERLQRLRQQGGDKAVYHLAEGILYLQESNSPSADQAFRQALALDAKMASAYIFLGTLSWRENDLAQAESMFKTAAELSPARSTRQLHWPDLKAGTGATAEARSFLEELVKKAPDFLPALNRLAQLDLAESRTNECSRWITKVLAIDPANYDGRVLLARLKLRQGQATQAVEQLERLKSSYPRAAEVHYQLGLAHLFANDLAKAVGSLEQAAALDPNLTPVVLLLAELKTRQGDAAAAIGWLTGLLQRNPNLQEGYFLLANAYRLRGTLDDAVRVYRGIIKADPKNPTAPLLMGIVLREQKKNKEARQAFEKAAELGPDSVPVLQQLVELDLETKNYPAAQQRVQKAIEKHPTIAALQFIKAQVHSAKRETNEAEAALQQSIALDPNFRDAYLALAQIYIGSKKPQQALEKLQGIVTRNPKDIAALVEIAMLKESMADYAGARDAYEKLLAVSPQFSPALNNLAYLYAVRLKQPAKGFELAQKGRRLLPNDPTIADTLGWTLYLRGDYAGALPLFQESAGKLLDEPEIQYHLGMAHYMMGNEEPARAALQRAAQAGKKFVGKDEAKQKLLNLRADAGKPAPEIMQSLEKAAAQSPNDVVLLQRLGSLYEQSGMMEKARDVSERVLKINPKAVRPMLLLARVYGARTDGGQRALEYAKMARAAAPDDAQTAYAAGCAAFRAGQHDWAYDILQDSSRRLAGNADVLYDLAWAAYSVGRVAEAESAMQAALRTGTNFSKAGSARQFLQLASLTSNPATISQAAPKIKEALRADSSYVPALFAGALVWEQSGNYPEAKKLYEQALERYPRFAPATRNLAILYANHLDDARTGYRLATEARRTLPEDVELAKALGKLAYWRGEYPYAAQVLKEALQQKGADAEAYYYLGMSQHRLKQKADSAASLHQALALNLEAKQVEEAERVLAELK